MRAFWLLLAVFALAACNGFEGGNTKPDGVRILSGRIVPPDPTLLSRGQVALELAAASVDASQESPVRAFAAGLSFNPADGSSFRIALPSDHAFVLFFQVPRTSAPEPGTLVARLRFPKNAAGDLTDILPAKGENAPDLQDIDLGTVEITRPANASGNQAADNVVLLGEKQSKNPLAAQDSDGDGVPDKDDPDDDDDLIPDEGDDDANGDGVADRFQSLDSLADMDGDRVPDALE
ncbi:MAG: hypothetical protein U1E65_23890 [Myxococcota bacterium]